jgi:hypothetical protein
MNSMVYGSYHGSKIGKIGRVWPGVPGAPVNGTTRAYGGHGQGRCGGAGTARGAVAGARCQNRGRWRGHRSPGAEP